MHLPKYVAVFGEAGGGGGGGGSVVVVVVLWLSAFMLQLIN